MERETEVGNVVVAHPDHRMFKGKEPGLGEVITHYPMAIPVLEQRYRDIVLQQYGIDIHRVPGSVMCPDFEVLLQLVTNRPWYFTAGLASAVPFRHRVAIHTNREALPLPAVANVRQIVCDVFAKTLKPHAES